VVRRKRKATEKFLKKDIADLLANGLDINAHGRVILAFSFSFTLCSSDLISMRFFFFFCYLFGC
jgi:hypothetical protein